MTMRNDCAPLDLFPSEADSGVFDATTGKISSAVPPGHSVGPQGVVAHAFQNAEHERVSFSGDPYWQIRRVQLVRFVEAPQRPSVCPPVDLRASSSSRRLRSSRV